MKFRNPRTGIEMYYNDAGGEGRPMILVHGLSGNYTRWGPAADILRKKYRVVDYDLRGHSLSEKENGISCGFETHVEDLAGLMDHLGIESAIIAGHSMGGMIVQHFALKYPERVEKLVLCATTSCMIRSSLKRFVLLFLTNILLLLPGILAFAVSKKTAGKPRELFPEKDRPELRPAPLPLVKCLRAIIGLDIRKEISGLRTPCLVLSSSEDELIAPSLVKALAGEIENARFVEIYNHSHYLPIEQPRAVAAAIEEFAGA